MERNERESKGAECNERRPSFFSPVFFFSFSPPCFLCHKPRFFFSSGSPVEKGKQKALSPCRSLSRSVYLESSRTPLLREETLLLKRRCRRDEAKRRRPMLDRDCLLSPPRRDDFRSPLSLSLFSHSIHQMHNQQTLTGKTITLEVESVRR